MICNPEEASFYHCCIMPKMCKSSSCMAWKNVVKKVPVPGTENEIFKDEYTGEGYCGHIKH